MTASEDDRIRMVQGDITEQDVDAIVNAANSTLLGGGGVDGAIHGKGGHSILEACEVIRRTEYPHGMPTGNAVVTTAGKLPAKAVIHTVGPVWNGGSRDEPELLANAYRNSMQRALENGHRTVAFPSISTGAYRYPLDDAAKIALETVRAFLAEHGAAFDEVRFVLFSEHDLRAYEAALRKLAK